MAKDLNSKSTVQSLMEYGIKMAKAVVSSPCSTDEDGWWRLIPKIMEDSYVLLLGDGSPTYAIGTFIRTEHEKYEGKVKGFFGGFHLGLEGHWKRGSIFGLSHLHDIFSTWRTTSGQLKWVMQPSNPNQIQEELVMYTLAMYVSAIQSLLKSRQNNANYDGQAIILSAPDVIDFMVQRAHEQPLVMVMLLELQFEVVGFILQEAEKSLIAVCIIHCRSTLPFFLLALTCHKVRHYAD